MLTLSLRLALTLLEVAGPLKLLEYHVSQGEILNWHKNALTMTTRHILGHHP